MTKIERPIKVASPQRGGEKFSEKEGSYVYDTKIVCMKVWSRLRIYCKNGGGEGMCSVHRNGKIVGIHRTT